MSKRGRPPNGDYPVKIFARVSEEQKAFIESLDVNTSEAIRAALEYARAHEDAFRAWVGEGSG